MGNLRKPDRDAKSGKLAASGARTLVEFAFILPIVLLFLLRVI
jgi:hypothetical protein